MRTQRLHKRSQQDWFLTSQAFLTARVQVFVLANLRACHPPTNWEDTRRTRFKNASNQHHDYKE